MANRIMLNQTSYHGAGAIEEIANEAKAHGFKKAFVCSDLHASGGIFKCSGIAWNGSDGEACHTSETLYGRSNPDVRQ